MTSMLAAWRSLMLTWLDVMWTLSACPVKSRGGGLAETSTFVSVPEKPLALRAPVTSAPTPSGRANHSRQKATANKMTSWIRQDRIRSWPPWAPPGTR
jgi:hypothetical protein